MKPETALKRKRAAELLARGDTIEEIAELMETQVKKVKWWLNPRPAKQDAKQEQQKRKRAVRAPDSVYRAPQFVKVDVLKPTAEPVSVVHVVPVKPMSTKQNTLRVMSDLIESASGEVVDVAAWDFDQLVRLLKHPVELCAILRILEPGRPGDSPGTEYGRAARAHRAAIIGPAEEALQAAEAARREKKLVTRRQRREEHQARIRQLQLAAASDEPPEAADLRSSCAPA